MNHAQDMVDLATRISHGLPHLGPVAPLQFVGEGFRSMAVETAEGILIRIGKVAEAAHGFELENQVLPLVARSVAATVPNPQWHIAPCSDFPYGALGYRKIPGSTPRPEDASLSEHFIPELAEFMVSLHSMPVDEVLGLGVEKVDPVERLMRARPVVTPLLERRLPPPEFDHIERWWVSVSTDLASTSFKPSVCHHDLWYENLLVDEDGHLSGVLDWSHIEVGDLAHDFAAIHHFGEELTAQLIQDYRAAGGQLDEHSLARIKRYWEGRHLGGLAWAIENDVPKEIEDGIRKLRSGPLLG